MDWLSPKLQFKVHGPIYPLIVAYFAQLHGFVELASRGFFLRARTLSPSDRERLLINLPAGNAGAAARVLGGQGITSLLDNPSPGSIVGEPIKVDVDDLATSLFVDPEPAIRHFNQQSAGALLILAWEHTQSIHQPEPLWEFLRHLRNAAAHGGKFHFSSTEPRKPAVWREKKIDRSLQGAALFAAPIDTGFVGPGDVIHLLADIDAAFVS